MSWLGGHLPESPSFASTCSGFIADGDKAGLAKALVNVVPQLLSSQSLAAAALQVPLTYLSHLIATESPSLSSEYLKALSTSPQGLTSMATFYNFLTDSQKDMKVDTLTALLSHATVTGQQAVLLPALSTVDALLPTLGLSPRRSVLESLSLALAGTPHGYSYTLQYLRTYPQSSPLTLPALKLAQSAIKAGLADVRKALDLASLPCLSSIEEHASGLVKLLRLYVSATYAEFSSYLGSEAGAKVVSDEGLDVAVLEENMKVLELLDLCNRERLVGYDDVAAALGASSDGEVEAWIVKTTQLGLVKARMDQVGRVVEVGESRKRRFGKEGWEEVRDVLGRWGKEVDGVISKGGR